MCLNRYYENQLLIIDTTIYYAVNILRVCSYTHFINTHFWISWYHGIQKIKKYPGIYAGLLRSGFPAKINVNMICHVDWVFIHTKDSRTFRVLIVDTNIKIIEIINTVKAYVKPDEFILYLLSSSKGWLHLRKCYICDKLNFK